MQEYFTQQGLEKLKKELDFLKNTKQKEITQQLKHAVSFGDLSENAAYHEAKNAQAFLRGRVLELEKMLVHAKIIEDKKTGAIQMGSKVTIQCNKENDILEIVGQEEADPFKSRISLQSPLGKALCNKEKGDIVEIETPAGKIKYKIIAVE